MRGHEDSPPAAPASGPSAPRQIVESLVLLAVAVMLFRTFAAEGYLISTGSMAPSLLGYHRRVVCPHCRYQFARGAAFDKEHEGDSAGHQDDARSSDLLAVCPNCGWDHIECSAIPRCEGDQLLVHKHAYVLRDPRRWEVIVFRNTTDSSHAYVKRLAGLPGETIQIQSGNVFADGRLQRKPFEVQRALRVLVSNEDYQPADDPDWQPRWIPQRTGSRWQRQGGQFEIAAADVMGEGTDWIQYRHWVRSGGNHETAVRLEKWPAGLRAPQGNGGPLAYDRATGVLRCTGALTALELKRWLSESNDPEFRRALYLLYELSHCAPVTNTSAYNGTGAPAEHEVRELMTELRVDVQQGSGRFEIEMSDGQHDCVAAFDFARERLELLLGGDPVPVAESSLEPGLFAAPAVVTMSMFDQQALVAVNGKPLFGGYEFKLSTASLRGPPSIRLGAEGINCRLSHLCVYRDVYYTPKLPHGTEPVSLSEEEFFVLGDNSSVSLDSRVWQDPAVPRSALIGKPLFVHLPSKPGRIEWGDRDWQVRIPDFSRIRYIH